MFELPRYVIKAGRVIVEQGEIREDTYGKTLHVAPEYDRDVEPDISRWFDEILLDPVAKLPSRRQLSARPRGDHLNPESGMGVPEARRRGRLGMPRRWEGRP